MARGGRGGSCGAELIYGAIYAPIRGDLFMIHNTHVLTHVLALGGAARDVAPRALGAAPRAVAGGARGERGRCWLPRPLVVYSIIVAV